jgi:uncharacterized protein YbaR (Trm112 family)
MKGFLRLLGLAALFGFAVVVVRAVKQYREDSVFDLGSASAPSGGFGNESRGISRELLDLLADPGDKGPVELLTDDSGKEWIVNRRNGFRYPVEDGIPILLLDEGEKNKDTSLIS